MKKENHLLQLSPFHFIAGFKFSLLFLTIGMMALLVGCSTPSLPVELSPEAKRNIEIAHLSQQLETSGGTHVIQTGQTMRVIFASDAIFNPHSANLTASAKTTLGKLSKLMIMLETTSVEVSAYTNVEPNVMQNKALSTRQAEVVANALWMKGTDARLVYSVGYGAKPALGLPSNLAGTADRRVEVVFQYLPLLSSLVN